MLVFPLHWDQGQRRRPLDGFFEGPLQELEQGETQGCQRLRWEHLTQIGDNCNSVVEGWGRLFELDQEFFMSSEEAGSLYTL